MRLPFIIKKSIYRYYIPIPLPFLPFFFDFFLVVLAFLFVDLLVPELLLTAGAPLLTIKVTLF